MQYLEYIKLGLAVVGFLVDLIKDIKAGKANSDSAVDNGVNLLSQLGEVAKVKELNGADLSQLAPDLKLLFAKLHELRA